MIAVGLGTGFSYSERTDARPVPTGSPPATAIDRDSVLLGNSTDPRSCVADFDDPYQVIDPAMVTQGLPYAELPIPERTGYVFAGWYTSIQAATKLDEAARVNRARDVACTNRHVRLYAGWVTPAWAQKEDTSVPILMYHQFTTKPGGENNALRNNFTYTGDFDAQIKYLADTRAYLPSWVELKSFIDGKLYLPAGSVVVSDDDADSTWLQLGVPIVTKYKVLTTSFVITRWRSAGSPSPYVLQRSHSHNMHSAGSNGKGRILTWTDGQIVADLTTSANILGAREVFAYPFGDFDARSKTDVQAAGFDMAVTTKGGRVMPGCDKLALPRERISYGESLASFERIVAETAPR